MKHLLGLEGLSAARAHAPPRRGGEIRRRRRRGRAQARRPEGQGRRQPLLRAVHAHADQLRPRRPPARGRHARLLARRVQHQPRARRSSTPPRTSRRWASTWSSCGTRRPAHRTCWRKHLLPHVRVINAGDGAHEHPTQGLLDIFTIRQRLRPGRGPDRRPRRRHRPQPRRPQQHSRADEARGEGHRLRPDDAGSAGGRPARRRGGAPARRRSCRAATC